MTAALSPEHDPARSVQTSCEIATVIRRVAEYAGYDSRMTMESGSQSQADLEAIADYNQIPLYRCELPEQWWRLELGPFIGQLRRADRQQVVAVLPNRSGEFWFVDQTGRIQKIRNAQEAQALSHRAWFIAPVIDQSKHIDVVADQNVQREQRLAASISSLLAMAKHFWTKSLAAIVLCLSLSILLSFVTPVVLSQIIDRALPLADRSFVISCILLLVSFNVSQSLLALMRNMLVANALASMSLPLQAAVTWRLLQSPIAFFRDRNAGDLAHRNLLITSVSWQYGSVLFECFFTGIITVSSCAIAAWLSPTLFAIGLPVSVLEAAVYYLVVRKIRDHAIQLELTRSQLLGRIVRWLKSIALVKSSGIESSAVRDLGTIQQSNIDKQSRLQRLEDIRKIIGTLLPACGFIVILNAAYHLSLDKHAVLTIGSIAGFIAAYRVFSTGLSGLASGLAEFVSVRSQLALMRPLLDQAVESFADSTRLVPFKGQIEFSNVSFSYQDSDSGVHNASFMIEPGEFVGVLGRSGSGKSTLLRLMLGLETPHSGVIRLDGCNSKSLDWHCIRQQIGSVQQSARLIHGTIRENIINGRSYPETQIRKVLEIVELAATVDSLPLRLETIVSQSGANLSGGQCQRILLARALVASPNMLVLDEAMSGLDEGQQNRILNRLKRLGITIVYVSHRQSSFVEADRILSIENGLVVESQRKPATVGSAILA